MLARNYEDGAELVGLIDYTQSGYLFQYHNNVLKSDDINIQRIC